MIVILTLEDCKNAVKTVIWLTEPLNNYDIYDISIYDRSNGKFHVILL